MRRDQIALQLYTVRDLTARDLPGTLQAVADAGYRSVEVAGLRDTPARDLATWLADAGLRAVSSHESIAWFRESVDAVADRLSALGADRVVVPWMPVEDRRTADDVRRFADELNRLTPILADRGVRLGYHNHDFEFADLDGTTIWDILLERLAPEIDLQPDVYWIAVGGRDPVATIREVAGRVRMLHLKDLVADPDPRDVPVGQGSLDLGSIVAAGRDAGVEWYVAEQDHPLAPIDDIRAAYDHLASLADRPLPAGT